MELVGAIGLEPTTPTMSRWCSNQLSYAPTTKPCILPFSRLTRKETSSTPALTLLLHNLGKRSCILPFPAQQSGVTAQVQNILAQRGTGLVGF